MSRFDNSAQENQYYDDWLEENGLSNGEVIGDKEPILHRWLMETQFPDEEWLIDKLIPANGITLLSAPPASYKTWVLLDMVVALASEKNWLNEFESSYAQVLIVDEENNAALIQKRLRALTDETNLAIYIHPMTGYELTDRLVEDLILACMLRDIQLVTFDSLIRIHDGNENDAGEMAKVFAKLRKITEAGITVLVTHHNRKPGAGTQNLAYEMRGSSDILAAVDCHLAIVRDEDSNRLVLKQTKNRYMPEVDPINLEVISSGEQVEIKYTGTHQTTQDKRSTLREAVLEFLSDHESLIQREIESKLTAHGKKVNRRTLVAELIQMEGEELISKSQGQRNSYVYTITDKGKDYSEAVV